MDSIRGDIATGAGNASTPVSSNSTGENKLNPETSQKIKRFVANYNAINSKRNEIASKANVLLVDRQILIKDRSELTKVIKQLDQSIRRGGFVQPQVAAALMTRLGQYDNAINRLEREIKFYDTKVQAYDTEMTQMRNRAGLR